MSRAGKQRAQRTAKVEATFIERPRIINRVQFAFLIGLLGTAIAAIAWMWMSSGGRTTLESRSTAPQRSMDRISAPLLAPNSPRTLEGLLAIEPAKLDALDIARVNLLCTENLPGAEELDVEHCLGQLDQWADYVRLETERHLQGFRRSPAEYDHSEGYFRMLMLVTVLQQDLAVHYNMERLEKMNFSNAKDLFIHGMVPVREESQQRTNGGTCTSMPVLYTAVARRLRYPVKLVLAKGHVFCRWDGPDDRFNIEGASRGMHKYPDDHYRTWPHAISDAEINANHFLVSLSSAEELALFLAGRGHCLMENGRRREARDAFAAARRLAPHDPSYVAWQLNAEGRQGVGYASHGYIPNTRPLVYRPPKMDSPLFSAQNEISAGIGPAQAQRPWEIRPHPGLSARGRPRSPWDAANWSDVPIPNGSRAHSGN